MKTLLICLAIIVMAVIGIGHYSSAQASSDKFDGNCTGQETAGRCADKPLIQPTPTPVTPPIVIGNVPGFTGK